MTVDIERSTKTCYSNGPEVLAVHMQSRLQPLDELLAVVHPMEQAYEQAFKKSAVYKQAAAATLKAKADEHAAQTKLEQEERARKNAEAAARDASARELQARAEQLKYKDADARKAAAEAELIKQQVALREAEQRTATAQAEMDLWAEERRRLGRMQEVAARQAAAVAADSAAARQQAADRAAATRAEAEQALEQARLEAAKAQAEQFKWAAAASQAVRDKEQAKAAKATAEALHRQAEQALLQARADASRLAQSQAAQAQAEQQLSIAKAREHDARQAADSVAAMRAVAERAEAQIKYELENATRGKLQLEAADRHRRRLERKRELGGLTAVFPAWFRGLLAFAALLSFLALVSCLNSSSMFLNIPGAQQPRSVLIAMLLVCGFLWSIASIGLILVAVKRTERVRAVTDVESQDQGHHRDHVVLDWWHDSTKSAGAEDSEAWRHWEVVALSTLTVLIASPVVSGLIAPFVYLWDLIFGARVGGAVPKLLPGFGSMRLLVALCYMQTVLVFFPCMICSGEALRLTNSCLVPAVVPAMSSSQSKNGWPWPPPSPAPPTPPAITMSNCPFDGGRQAAQFSLGMCILAFFCNFGLWIAHMSTKVRMFDFSSDMQVKHRPYWDLIKQALLGLCLIIVSPFLLLYLAAEHCFEAANSCSCSFRAHEVAVIAGVFIFVVVLVVIIAAAAST